MRREIRRLAIAAAWVAGSFACTTPAVAHLALDGADDFTAGLLHPLIVPGQMLVIASAGLLLGQQGMAAIRAALPALTVTLIGGLAAGGFGVDLGATNLALLALAAAFGLLVALARPLPLALPIVLGACAGFAIGLDSAPETGAVWSGAMALLGSGVSVLLILLNIVALASAAKRPWQTIGLRVVGSWIGAAALMVSALALHGLRAA